MEVGKMLCDLNVASFFVFKRVFSEKFKYGWNYCKAFEKWRNSTLDEY